MVLRWTNPFAKPHISHEAKIAVHVHRFLSGHCSSKSIWSMATKYLAISRRWSPLARRVSPSLQSPGSGRLGKPQHAKTDAFAALGAAGLNKKVRTERDHYAADVQWLELRRVR